jgi:hypothetical protein
MTPKVIVAVACSIVSISIAQYVVDATPVQTVVIALAAIWSNALTDRILNGRRT